MKSLLILISFLTASLLLSELHSQPPIIDSLEVLINNHVEKDTIRINLLNEAAYALYRIDIDKTLAYAKEAEKLATQLDFAKGEAESLRLIGIYYDLKADYPKALEYYKKSLAIAVELGGKVEIAKAYNNIGVIYDCLGEYSDAMNYYHKSMEMREKLGNEVLLANSYANIGIIYHVWGDYPKALEYSIKSLQLREKNDKIGVASSYNNIGIIYSAQGDYQKALEYYHKSLKIREEIGNISGVANSYMGISSIYISQEDYSNALIYCYKALKIRKELEDKNGISNTYCIIGEIYDHQDNYSKSLEYFQKALDLSIEIGAKSIELSTYIGLANLYLNQNKLNEAYKFGKKAYDLSEEMGNVSSKKESAGILADCANKMGLYKNAYEYQLEFKSLNDSLYNEKNTKKLTGLEYKFKYEKEKQEAELMQQRKDAIIKEEAKIQKIVRNSFIAGFILMFLLVLVVFRSLLQKRKANRNLAKQKEKIEEKNKELFAMNKEIQTQSEKVKCTNEKLRISNVTKDKFFSIIAHDLKSPFNSILGFSELLLENHKEINEVEREQYITQISNSSKSTYNLLENLLTWSYSQSGRMEFLPEKINIDLLIQEILLLSNTVAKNKNIKLYYDKVMELSVVADKNMTNTILRNLISNAIKFTHQNGTVTISVHRLKEQDYVEISVADTGIGIPKEVISDLFSIDKSTSTPDTEDNKGTGLGLILCKEFVEINKGQIRVESEINKGSKFTFTLPVASE